MKRYRILVFPCGSEIGLEIHRSLSNSSHVELIGASSTDDHGKFVYRQYVGGIPFVDSPKLITTLAGIISQKQIDAIYPTMDRVIWKLKSHEQQLGCPVVAAPAEVTETCLSKTRTYDLFGGILNLPKRYKEIDKIDNFPVFIRPDMGYGTRGVHNAESREDLFCFFRDKKIDDYIITEYLSGPEFTIDCFTDRYRNLLFCGPRIRERIRNGISVNTKQVRAEGTDFHSTADKINKTLAMRGAWFFQLKRDDEGKLTLLEIAARLGGSSSLHRGLGINFALLSVYDVFDIDVEIELNDYEIELDRALNTIFRTNIKFSKVYVDFDDCLIADGQVNTKLVGFLYQCLNSNKNLILITKHSGNLLESLERYRLKELFHEIIHLNATEEKSEYIDKRDSIFIDDSFRERKKVRQRCHVPVFSLDMIDMLMSSQ